MAVLLLRVTRGCVDLQMCGYVRQLTLLLPHKRAVRGCVAAVWLPVCCVPGYRAACCYGMAIPRYVVAHLCGCAAAGVLGAETLRLCTCMAV